MNSYQIFVIRFKRALSTGNYEALMNIFENDAKDQLQIVSTEHLEFLVDGILGGTDGLLCFLNSALKDYVPQKHSDDIFKKGFQFLSLFIENFHQVTCFKKYINQIKDICYMTLCKKCNSYIQRDASHTFTKLIEHFSGQNLELDTTFKKFVFVFPVISKRERRFIYCVLGKIIKHNKNVCLSRIQVDAIFKYLHSDALEEFSDLKETSYSFHLYFDAISDILDNAEPPNEIRNKFFEDIYGWIKSISSSSKFTLLNSAIGLLNRHMNCFQDLLYTDYQLWHRVLQRLSCEKCTSNYAQHALKTFYRIIGEILENQRKEESKTVLQYFLDKFNEAFANAKLDLITLRLTVFGYSQMAGPSKTHLPEYNIRQMYSTVTNCALPLCFSEQSDSTNIENICCYQEALSEMLCHISDITNEKINVLIKLSTYTIKQFPNLEISHNARAISSFVKIICNLASIDRSLLQRYLDNIIYDGIAWSCSHTLALDVELQQEQRNLQQPPISYKNYLLLWTQLLSIKKYERHFTVQLVAETLVNACITLIDRLDISVKQYEDTSLSDIAFTQSAVNQTDFRVFTNLVDLYVDLMDASDISLYTDIISDFLREIIILSYKYPLISGFYKLARAALKIFDCTTEKNEENEIEKLVFNYLTNTLKLLSTFSNELLIACLYLILDEPGISYVIAVVPFSRLVPAFKTAFTMGLSDLELAYSALAALKIWIDSRQLRKDENIDELLGEIIPHLESYLRSTESTVEMSQELTTTKKARLKRIGLMDTEYTLRNFQQRILLFLGSLDHNVLSSFLYERSLNTGASWDRKNLLRYILFLPDARLTLHFDRMLPRVITLARDSSDRRTRIAACEVLHSIAILVIGLTSERLNSLDSFVTLYAPLCPILLALGCDPDEVVRGLFHPLTLQLMHWLSSRLMLQSSIVPLVLDSLFDSLCNDANPSLREFAGTCLAEFTFWSIRQAVDDERDTQSNVYQIVKRINHFALHPSIRKRVAAAVAFNHVYVILRENDDIVSTYWLEMFYCFVCSMDGCENPSIINALGHIERVMKAKASVLNVAAQGRKKPNDFDDATLTHTLYWLLSQCGVLDEHYRATCKKLYVNISQYAVGGSAQKTTRTFVEIYGMDRLNSIILRDLKPNTKDISIINIKNLLKTLDYYTWLIEKQLLPVETLFSTCSGTQEHLVFVCIHDFSHKLLETATATTKMKFREIDELQCKAVMAILKFVQILLDVNEVDILPESLWNESLFKLIIKCVIHPQAIGFDVKNIKMTDELTNILEILLNTMRLRFNDTLANSFQTYLMSSVLRYVPHLLDLCNIVQSNSCDKQIQHVNGLMILERCNLFDRSVPEIGAFTNRVGIIEQIYSFLVSKRVGELTCSDLSAQISEYLQVLMKLQLLRHEVSTTETLIRLISNNTLIVDVDLMKITHGKYFLHKFNNVIFTYMLTNVDSITYILNKLSRDNPVFLLKLIEDALLHLKRHRRVLQEHTNDILDVILRRFACLESAVIGSNVGSHTERLINIYGTAVRLMSKPTDIKLNASYCELYTWIVQQLSGNHDIEYKTQILRNFFICLTDVTDREEDICKLSCLYTLKNDRLSLFPHLSDMTVSPMKVVNCFETLLVLLSATGSIIALDCLMNFAAGAGKSLFKNKLKDHLRKYYRWETSNNVERVLSSLEMTYQKFIRNTSVTERFDILHEFLLPAFDCCDTLMIERFFERNIHELYAISQRKIDNINNENGQFNIVLKLGCYELLAIMVTRVEENKIVDANGAIVQNADLGNVQNGRELLQNLFRNALNVRALRINQPEYRENMRLLQCSAYNFTLAVISLNNKKHVYKTAFGEDQKRGLLIWSNIVDCNKYYQLKEQGFLKYPKEREITVNIKSSTVDRGRERAASNQHRYSHIHTYDLSSSSLNEDINAYDFNKCVLLPESAVNFQRELNTMNVILENDDFNEHECMPNICGILRRFNSLEGQVSEQPEWLKFFIGSMQDKNVPRNIRFFMLKIVNNMGDDVFKPYAKFLLPKIAQVITNYLKVDDLNYIITDSLETLILWQDNVDDENVGREEIQNLFTTLVDKILVKRQIKHKGIYNYNLELIYRIVKKWYDCLTEPISYLINKIVSAQETTVDLIVRFLRDNDEIAREIVEKNLTEDIVDLLLKPLCNWDQIQIDVLRHCECLGWYLKLQQENKRNEDAETAEKEDKIRNVKEKIFNILRSPPRNTQQLVYREKQLERIIVLCRTCPDLAVDYITVVIDITSVGKNRSHCLEIFAMAIPQFCDVENIVSNLRRIELQSVLTNREPFCELKALRIIYELVNMISPADLLPYVKLTIPYLGDNSAEHRGLVYNILMRIYKKYSADSNDESVTTLRSESVRNLLTALLDPSQELQARALRFWAEETDLGTDQSKERLAAVLNLRKKMNLPMNVKEENAYVLFVPLLILQLASRSRDYTRNMFNALNNCTYEDYKITVSWRRRNLSYITPMFVDSLASQMSCSLSQNVDNDHNTYDLTSSYYPLHDALRLRATQDLQFEPTVIDDEVSNADMTATYNNSSFDDVFDQATSSRQSQLIPCRRFPRFLAKSSNVGQEIRQQHIRKDIKRQEMIKQENIKQRNSVKLYRSYRNGDFPDIEIPHSSLIEPLQQLIKLDGLICKDITVYLFCSLIEETIELEKSDNFRRSIITNLKQILHDSEKDSAFNAVILETFLKLNVTDCDSRDIVRVSKTNGLNALGVLLLERSLQPDVNCFNDSLPIPKKKLKINENDVDITTTQIDQWAQLASLYTSLDDIDVVLSIFCEQTYDKNIQEAAKAIADSNWICARTAFEKAYEPTKIVPSMHEYCMEGLFEVMNNLCDWSTVNELVVQIDGNLKNVWDSSWRDWMIPCVCDAYVQMLADNCRDWETSGHDLQVIESWMNDPSRSDHIKTLIGENLVVFLLKSSPGKAGDILNDLLGKTGEQWVKLNPLCTELAIRKLRKLQVMSDLDATLKVLRYTDNMDYLDRMTTLLDFWTAKAPTMQDNLQQWTKLAAYRRYSSTLFDDILDNIIGDDYTERVDEIKTRICRVNHLMRLNIIDAALKQRHQYVAQKHSSYLKKVSADLLPRQELLEVKIRCLCADIETDTLRKMCDYTCSWRYSQKLLKKICDDNTSSIDVNTSIALREHIGALASTIEYLSRENNTFAETLMKSIAEDGNVLQDIGAEQSDDLANVRELLLQYSVDKLKSCSDSAATATETVSCKVGEHYYALTRHCYNRLTNGQIMNKAEQDDIFQNFVFATLRAMYHDYYEATHYFPCLLRPVWLQWNGAAQRTFEGECLKPQPWLFLRWRDLLFSYLSTQIMVIPVIEKLAKAYPDAVAYTYLLAVEKNPAILHDCKTQRIREILQNKVAKIEQFLLAIQYVAQPEHYLKYYLNKAMNRLSKGDMSAFEWLLSKVYTPISTAAGERNPRPGSVYNVIAKYEDEIKNLDPTNYDATRMSVQRIKDSLDKSLNNRASKKRLKEYSPFLHAYADGDIEVPGQYTGSREPIPNYHAKIMRIEPIVEVMPSLRKPTRISIIGENGREYKFLVKFGEDLTIDHGLQQLYATMNRILSNDTACRQRRLAIDTYEVIPLSKSFGLIQWIEDTKSLEELVRFTFSMSDINRCESLIKNYMSWIASAAPSSKRISDQYKAAIVKYKRAEVVTKMKHLIDQTKRNGLRETFDVISPSPESFVTLRRNFVASYATMCAAHWLSGIGDRHLQNTLVVVGSGRCLGIDFGHAFGDGIRSPIPELVPFRLTPQILGLLQPFTQKHLLSTIMIHVIRALRDDKGPILACMDIFAHESVSRLTIYDEDTTDTDSTWSFKKNIIVIEKKLNGIHPSLITLEQLKETHNDEYITRYQAIITGNDEFTEARAVVQNNCLTSSEQVNCLLDQATDLNILGRMYSKWEPWL